jgi:hypothetical protein
MTLNSSPRTKNIVILSLAETCTFTKKTSKKTEKESVPTNNKLAKRRPFTHGNSFSSSTLRTSESRLFHSSQATGQPSRTAQFYNFKTFITKKMRLSKDKIPLLTKTMTWPSPKMHSLFKSKIPSMMMSTLIWQAWTLIKWHKKFRSFRFSIHLEKKSEILFSSFSSKSTIRIRKSTRLEMQRISFTWF